jgi:hypothetical protein
MEIISRISRGSKMDQIYIPKNRSGFDVGSYVVLKPLKEEENIENPYFYNIKSIEPLKLEIIKSIISIIDKNCNYDNVIFTGSFLDEGFNFNDIDVILISECNLNKKIIEDKIKIKIHLIQLNNKDLIKGLSTDPLYQMMLSRCIAKKRFIYNVKHKINYKLLDLHLLKSKTLIDNFNVLGGDEKYYLTRNLISIFLYIKGKEINKEVVDKEIKKIFGVNIKEIKQNILDNKFLKEYKNTYIKTFDKIMGSIKNDTKQE